MAGRPLRRRERRPFAANRARQHRLRAEFFTPMRLHGPPRSRREPRAEASKRCQPASQLAFRSESSVASKRLRSDPLATGTNCSNDYCSTQTFSEIPQQILRPHSISDVVYDQYGDFPCSGKFRRESTARVFLRNESRDVLSPGSDSKNSCKQLTYGLSVSERFQDIKYDCSTPSIPLEYQHPNKSN